MRLTTKTRYGVRAMAELARGYPGEAIPLRTISECQQISLKYLEQVIAVLKAAGLVKAVRGYGGGYKLAKPPEKTTLREIFVALEGPPSLVDCVDDAESCPMHPTCPTRKTWVEMSEALSGVLASTTVGDLVGRRRARRNPRGRSERRRRPST